MSTMESGIPAAAPVRGAVRVSERTRVGLGVAGAALALGMAGDALLRSAPWGLNLALWTAALVLAIAGLQRWAKTDDAAAGWIPLALGTVAMIAWRDSYTLKALDLAALGTILGLAMMRARGGEVKLAGLAHHAIGVAASAGDAAVGAARLLFGDVRWSELRTDGAARQGVAVLRGGALALPLLLVFGSLLAAADARFQRLVGGVSFDLPVVLGHVLFALLVAWIAGGILRTMTMGGEQPGPKITRPEVLSLGIVEVGMVIGLLDLLFLSFVLVQLPYFFGSGAALTQPGTATFSEYARRGFFELVTVAGLVLPMLLTADWLLRRERPGHERVFRVLAGVQVALLFVIMGSGLHRMRLYQGAYGLTELRLYTTVFMLWLGVVFCWFGWTVLRGRRERFAWGALTTALEALVLLHVVNPDGMIVRVNASRADAPTRFDAPYAASLSADAVPPLLAALPAVRPELRCMAAERLLDRWHAADADWRSWSLSRGRARAAVAKRQQELKSMTPCAPVLTTLAPATAAAASRPAIAPPATDMAIMPGYQHATVPPGDVVPAAVATQANGVAPTSGAAAAAPALVVGAQTAAPMGGAELRRAP
jgi:TM2 domain-containing membrane protein YozV